MSYQKDSSFTPQWGDPQIIIPDDDSVLPKFRATPDSRVIHVPLIYVLLIGIIESKFMTVKPAMNLRSSNLELNLLNRR
jgi:hypothetical protein